MWILILESCLKWGWRLACQRRSSPTFDFRHEAQALLEVGADAVEAPAELGVAAVLVGAAGVVTRVQLVAALGHGRDLRHNKGE